MFVTSLENFIPRYKMFLGIEIFFQRKRWESNSHEYENKFMYNYIFISLLYKGSWKYYNINQTSFLKTL